MAHCVVPGAEEILDKEYKVLDKGFVRLVDYLGGDARIVQAARVSYGEGTTTYRKDAALIEYLLRNRHTSPFEQVILTFHAKMPIFVARQWIRHRTARLNEVSGRYSVMNDDFFVPDSGSIALQSTDNKQGRNPEPVDPATAERIRSAMTDAQRRAYDEYTALLETGIARELARVNLPLSLYTEWYWQIDLHNLFHFLELRLDPHAQAEIREYAKVMLEIARAICPVATRAFEDHVAGGSAFSRAEFEALRALVAERTDDDVRSAAESAGLTGRAAERFAQKLTTGRRL